MNSQVLLVVAVLFAAASITTGDHTKGIRSQGQFGKSSVIDAGLNLVREV